VKELQLIAIVNIAAVLLILTSFPKVCLLHLLIIIN